MSPATGRFVEEVLEQSRPVRAFMAGKLIESLEVQSAPELSEAWKTEIQKRCREIDNGQAELRNAEDVFNDIELDG